jgi:phosphate-selective porin OprO/OprP
MKKGIASAVLLAVALAGQNVSAKSLEDVLKEKGVITEEDYKAVIKSRPVSYKPGDGFTFLSPDEKFKLSIGGRLQARYSFTDNDANSNVSDASNWQVRRMKTWMKGHAYSKDLTYKMQVNFASGDSKKLLEIASLNYRLTDELQIFAGQDKVPFARQELTSSGAQQFVDRSNATDTFKPSYDAGVMLHGKVAKGLVDYNFGWFGGGGQSNFRSNTNDNAIAARLVVNPLGAMKYSEGDTDHSEKPLVSFGVDYYRNKFVKGESNNTTFYQKGWLNKDTIFVANEKIEVNTASADLAFKWLGASVQAEYFWAQADGSLAPEKIRRAHGLYAQAGYFIIPKQLELAVRYSYVDPDRDKPLNLQTETQGAISYYFNKHTLKLQGDVTNIHKQHGVGKSATDDLQCRLQAQIIF